MMTTRLSDKAIGHGLAVICTLMWATAFVLNKMLFNAELDPLLVILFRQTLALLAASAVCAVKYRHMPRIAKTPLLTRLKQDKKLIVAGILGVAVYYIFDNFAVKFTFVSNASLLLTTSPIMAALISRYIIKDGQKFSVGFILGTVLCFAGAAIIIFNGSLVLQLSPAGDLLAIGAAAIWAVYCTLVNSIAGENSRRPQPRSLLQLTRYYLFWGALAMWVFYLAAGGDFADLAVYTTQQWAIVYFLGIVASFLTLMCWNGSVPRIGAVKCSLYMFATPLLVILGSAMVLDEHLTIVSALGAGLLLLGMALAQGFIHLQRRAA